MHVEFFHPEVEILWEQTLYEQEMVDGRPINIDPVS